MTARSGMVVGDCRKTLQLLEDEMDLQCWRIHWVAALMLIRAVGHVLDTGGRQQGHGLARAAYKRWKSRNGLAITSTFGSLLLLRTVLATSGAYDVEKQIKVNRLQNYPKSNHSEELERVGPRKRIRSCTPYTALLEAHVRAALLYRAAPSLGIRARRDKDI